MHTRTIDMSTYSGSSRGSGSFDKWWNQPDAFKRSDLSGFPPLPPRPSPSKKPSVSRFPGVRARLNTLVSCAFGSNTGASRVYSRTAPAGPPNSTARPVLHIDPPEPTGLGLLAQSALDTAGSVLSTLGSGAASFFSSCFGQTATGSRSHEPPAYKDDRSDFSVTGIKYSPAPSGSTWSPRKKTGIMSRLTSGLSRLVSSSKPSYSSRHSHAPSGSASMGTGTAYCMPDYPVPVHVQAGSIPSEAPPSYDEVVSASQDSREQEAARWLKHQERMNEQHPSDWRSMWSEWIDNGFRPSTNNREHTGFGAISVPDW